VVAPLLDSKHRLPRRRPQAVARPRLAQRLDAASRAALTVLSAPAGFGKTTALTEWLATVPEGAASTAWVSLDGGDNDPALFWTYVITAVQAATGGAGASALPLLVSSSPSTQPALTALLNEVNGLSEDLVLVLDDYHVIEAPEVHEGMRFLLEHQPPRLHVVLATRTDPPLAIPRMRARGQLLEVRAADLRFTQEESGRYLNDLMGLGLDDGDVAALEDRTEGWIAALQLAALSLQGRGDASAFIAGFAGDDRYVVDYLVEEVLARQPPEVRDFLLQTSVLDRLTGPLCDAVTGRDGGAATLVALERANLFLVPLDDRRAWYRYHHLFSDVLTVHLRQEPAERVAELHRRASAWFEADGDTAQAINHALSGGDTSRAADLLELAIPVLSRQRREAELARWVRSLPEDVVRVRPVLGVAFVGALAQAADFGTVDARLSAIERALRPDGSTWAEEPPPGLVVVDEDGYRAVPATIELYRAALALAHGDLEGTVEHARQALHLAPPENDLVRAAAGALGGLASWTAGDLTSAHAAYTESVAGLTRAGFISDVLGCSIALGDVRQTQGRLGDAVHAYRRALDLAASDSGAGPLRGTADMHVAIAAVLLERDDLAGAAEHLSTSDGLGEHLGLPQHPYRSRVVLARLREADGDLDQALELLDHADRVYAGDYSPNARPVPAVRARLRLRRGELGHAQAWARQRHLSAEDDLSYLREYEHLTLARILIARHRTAGDTTALPQVLTLLQRLRAAAEEGQRGASVLEVRILQALAHHAHADAPAALGALSHAVALAQPEGFVRLFADEGPPMASLLKALTRQPAVDPGYVRRLLHATTRTAGTAGTQHRPVQPTGPVDPLSDRELDVLRLLGSDLDGPDIARALSVSLNTLRTHTKNIYAKLGVTSRRAAVSRAQELDLLPGSRRS
jgi:LuxR family maltose regulon positive regulatory protein